MYMYLSIYITSGTLRIVEILESNIVPISIIVDVREGDIRYQIENHFVDKVTLSL